LSLLLSRYCADESELLNCSVFDQVELCCEAAHNPIWPALEICGFFMSLMRIIALCYVSVYSPESTVCMSAVFMCVCVCLCKGQMCILCFSHVYIISVEKFCSLLEVREIN
jgi:hypothetical protein